MNRKDYLDRLFYPKSVAIIEASSSRIWQVKGIADRDYKGGFYLVSKKEKEILGIKCYEDISDLPDNIDLAIISITRKQLKELIEKCIEKNFYTLHIFTAGLGEYDEYGIELEYEIIELLKNSNTRAIGPNCMGVYSTGGRISYDPDFSKDQGTIAFVSQSGDITTRYVVKENSYGVKFSTVASIGNSIDLKFQDFIEYFSSDNNTNIIGAYFEGFSKSGGLEGKALLNILKKNKKPVLILRGGVTEQGKRSAGSHTGTIASNTNVWNSIFTQSNAIKMDTYEELMDATVAFYYCKEYYPNVNGILVIVWSGGAAVLGTDQIIKLGLNVPEIQEPTKSKLKSMISIGSVSNPLDLPWIGRQDKFPEICKLAINEPYIGGIILETIAPTDSDSDDHHEIYYNNLLKIFNYSKEVKKPFLLSLPFENVIQREQLKNKFIKNGVPVFSSIERAARAFAKLYKYGSKLVTKRIYF